MTTKSSRHLNVCCAFGLFECVCFLIFILSASTGESSYANDDAAQQHSAYTDAFVSDVELQRMNAEATRLKSESNYANVQSTLSHYSRVGDTKQPEYKDVFIRADELQRANDQLVVEHSE